MVVAGTDVDVAAQSVVVAPNDENDLAVRLEPDHAIGDVNARLLELARPVDVGLLVEPGLELDDDRHLLAVERCVDEVLDDARLRRCAIERHLDRANLRVLARLAKEPLYRSAKRLEGVVKQQRPVFSDGVENIAPPYEARRVHRPMIRVPMLWNVESR